MAGRTYYEQMLKLSMTPATRATQLLANLTLKMYCQHSLLRQYINRFGIAPPP